VWLPAARWRDAPEIVASVEVSQDVVIAFDGGATPVLMAALAIEWTRPVGAWLVVGDQYPAAMAARDISTLSWLIDLPMVVLSAADGTLDDHAEIFVSLLGAEPVNLATSVATLHNAINRPVPKSPVRVALSDEMPDTSVVMGRDLGGGAPWTSQRLSLD
jgi:hypothetical protein